MPNLFDIVRGHIEQNPRLRKQSMTQGVVIGPSGSHYKVSAGGFTFMCQCGLGDPLKAGDRVWIIVGRGTSRIVGLMGKDAAV
jgi:hypothetical protein